MFHPLQFEINIGEEYVPINDANQYLFHSGKKYDNPVLLYLHGGPGSVESLFAHAFQDILKEIFTIVHWDQRGAGKTFIKNRDKYPTIDSMVKDLYEIIQYLKRKYNKEKIVLLGRSWGTVLGSVFVKQYPEEITYFINVAPIISMLENERVAYKKMKGLIKKANDKKSLKKLEVIGDYPGEKITFDNEFLKKCMKIRKLHGKYGLAGKSDFPVFITAFKSPIFKLSDLLALSKILKVNRKILEYLQDFNLMTELADYEVPIYYILGEDDWQAPYVIAQEYFTKIKAPYKQLFLIPNAGHRIMLDQPDLFFEVLSQINIIEQNRDN
ncbi:alpha/beta hydrolase [Bacillus paramycoides]|uniref:alpha/beta fold hydrolase n=1 Tax=Bacillus paramycoides TaxID=2026194 RepID=UPI002E205EC4|nr:alpha/beta hydrolase [Bacillus paramycoides]